MSNVSTVVHAWLLFVFKDGEYKSVQYSASGHIFWNYFLVLVRSNNLHVSFRSKASLSERFSLMTFYLHARRKYLNQRHFQILWEDWITIAALWKSLEYADQ